MREIFTYGSVGGAPGNRCIYPEGGRAKAVALWTCICMRYLVSV